MSPQEIAVRGADRARQMAWARRQVRPGSATGLPPGLRSDRPFSTPVPDGTRERVPDEARARLVSAADGLLAGDWSMLGTLRPDIVSPDWFLDPVTNRRAPQRELAFRIDHRDENVTGNVKVVWELSRHHHLTVLAGAWWLTGDDKYADVVDRQLRSWWADNPFLSGVHWTSGIELGVRLTSWAWIRRLLDDWPKVTDLYEHNPDALRQIWWHQRYLAAFRSRGSSANNHVIAEACGRVVAACAFPWYAESDRWREDASDQLGRELRANTFDSGVNRELATDYHRFVTELGLVALAEADAAGHPLDGATRALLATSLDAAAAMIDVRGGAPRQGDGDEGRALVLDDPEGDGWAQMLALGAALLGPCPWWPEAPSTVASAVAGPLVTTRPSTGRATEVPQAFEDAGMYLLRSPVEEGPQIWCRYDAGPHGFLSIAAHAHADALAVEARYDGVEVLVDPGTYCYHGEPEWRSYFRSTLAHNTIEVDGTNQSIEGGPFMWTTHARSEVEPTRAGDNETYSASHRGYSGLDPELTHHRTVHLDRHTRNLSITDTVSGGGPHTLRLAFHLGPRMRVHLSGSGAELTWSTENGEVAAHLHLPAQLRWSEHRGETEPILGWYSPRFGERVPTTTLIGSGSFDGRLELHSGLAFPDHFGGMSAATSPARIRSLADTKGGVLDG